MSPEDKSEPSLAEVFFQQGAERHWRLETAKSVVGWLKRKTMNYEPVPGGSVKYPIYEDMFLSDCS